MVKKCRPSVSVVGIQLMCQLMCHGMVLSILRWMLLCLVHWALRGHEVLEDGLMLLWSYRGKLLEWQLRGLLAGEVHITQGEGKGFGHELIPESLRHLAH